MWISEQTVIISLDSIKYADGLVLLAKEETVLEGMTSRQTELGRCSGMEVNESLKGTITIIDYDRS
jgi:hypothetical protein